MNRLRRAWARLVEAAHHRQLTTAFVAMGIIVAVGGYSLDRVAQDNAHTAHVESVHNQARIDDEARIIRALHADLFCVERWANSTTRRTKAITPLATSRIEDLFHAFRAALHHHQREALRLAKRAIREDTAYRREVTRNPIPTPELRCRLLIPQPPPPGQYAHHAAHPSPAPSTVTRTVTVPGPTRTVVVTAPPGKHRGRRHGR